MHLAHLIAGIVEREIMRALGVQRQRNRPRGRAPVQRERLLQLLRRSPRTARELALITGRHQAIICRDLRLLIKTGRVVRVERGLYRCAP